MINVSSAWPRNSVLLSLSLLLLLGYMGIKNFLLFHAFAEGFTIIVSFTIAVIVLNTYSHIRDNFVPILGIAYFCSGFFDAIHTLGYEGIDIIPGAGPGLAPQVWIVARYLDSFGMLLAGVAFHKTVRLSWVLAVYMLVSVAAFLAIFQWQVFPLTFIPGQGLTPFKIYSEYLICLVLAASILLLMRHKTRFARPVYWSLLIFFIISIFTELSLTFYKTNGGWENVIGHLFKVTAFFFLYQAVVKTNLQEPYNQLAKSNEQLSEANTSLEEEVTERQAAQAALEKLNARLEDKVRERTQVLEETNATLEEEITERQAAQESLRETHDALEVSETHYRSLFDNMQNVFSLCKVVVDQEDRPTDLLYLEVNPAFEALYGLKRADVVGKLFAHIFPDAQEEQFEWVKELGEVALTGQSKNFEQYVGQLHGWFQFAAYSPEPGLVAMITVDITARRKAEEEQKRYAEEVAATNKELQAFTNIVAHDFRSPMVNLKGFSQELGGSLADLKKVLQEDKGCVSGKATAILEGEVPEALGFIQTAVDRLDRMVNALLKLARVGKRELAFGQVDCREVVNSVLRSFEHQISAKGVKVAVGPMPIIETDPLALEQIIGNLADNAIKYLDPGRPGEIGITCADEGDKYLFTVSDNGRGIAGEDCEKIFELFQRAGWQDAPGEGMGLAYVRTLVRQLGGRVWCESAVGAGTKMFFTLPKAKAAMIL